MPKAHKGTHRARVLGCGLARMAVTRRQEATLHLHRQEELGALRAYNMVVKVIRLSGPWKAQQAHQVQ